MQAERAVTSNQLSWWWAWLTHPLCRLLSSYQQLTDSHVRTLHHPHTSFPLLLSHSFPPVVASGSNFQLETDRHLHLHGRSPNCIFASSRCCMLFQLPRTSFCRTSSLSSLLLAAAAAVTGNNNKSRISGMRMLMMIMMILMKNRMDHHDPGSSSSEKNALAK